MNRRAKLLMTRAKIHSLRSERHALSGKTLFDKPVAQPTANRLTMEWLNERDNRAADFLLEEGNRWAAIASGCEAAMRRCEERYEFFGFDGQRAPNGTRRKVPA